MACWGAREAAGESGCLKKGHRESLLLNLDLAQRLEGLQALSEVAGHLRNWKARACPTKGCWRAGFGAATFLRCLRRAPRLQPVLALDYCLHLVDEARQQGGQRGHLFGKLIHSLFVFGAAFLGSMGASSSSAE